MTENLDNLTDVDRLDDIMGELPDSSEHHGPERRKYSLTKGDVLLIYRIAKIASNHQCPFDGIEAAEAETIKTVGASINRTQRIAAGIMIAGIVTGVLAGMWAAVKHFFLEWVKTGGAIK